MHLDQRTDHLLGPILRIFRASVLPVSFPLIGHAWMQFRTFVARKMRGCLSLPVPLPLPALGAGRRQPGTRAGKGKGKGKGTLGTTAGLKPSVAPKHPH